MATIYVYRWKCNNWLSHTAWMSWPHLSFDAVLSSVWTQIASHADTDKFVGSFGGKWMSEVLCVNAVSQAVQKEVVDKPKGTQGKGPHHQSDPNDRNYDTLQMGGLSKFCHILKFCATVHLPWSLCTHAICCLSVVLSRFVMLYVLQNSKVLLKETQVT